MISNGNEARQYFEDCGLTYNDITSGDICILVMLLNKNIKKACKNNEMSVTTMRMSEKIKNKYTTAGGLKECYLFINSHYFTQRECISFTKDGFIGFCGWADSRNTKPIVDSFMQWCDYLKSDEIPIVKGA